MKTLRLDSSGRCSVTELDRPKRQILTGYGARSALMRFDLRNYLTLRKWYEVYREVLTLSKD